MRYSSVQRSVGSVIQLIDGAVAQKVNISLADWNLVNGKYQALVATNQFSIVGAQVYNSNDDLLTADIRLNPNDILIIVNSTPDCRFDGYVNLIGK